MKILTSGAMVIALLLSTGASFAGVIGNGSFTGASGHTTSGNVSVSKSDGKIIVKLGKSFVLDGAPDPYVALGHGSKPVPGGVIRILKNNKGHQIYSISMKAVDLTKVNSVVIWCKKYSVPLGVAKIK